MNKKLQRYGLVILGLTLFSLFIWFKFIRKRLPKDIPFHPKFLGFIILLFVCCSYLYAVILLYKKPKGNKYLFDIVEILFSPLTEFDDFLKELMSDKSRNYFIENWKLKLENPKRLIIRYNIVPRIILLIILSIDVYFYHELYYIYHFVWISFFPLFTRYRKYSVKRHLKNGIEFLSHKVRIISTPYVHGVHPSEWPGNEHLLDPDDDPDEVIEKMALPLDIFINYQTNRIMNSLDPADYDIYFNNDYYAEYRKEVGRERLKPTDYENMQIITKPQIEKLVELSLILEKYNQTNYEDISVKRLRTLIFINYLFCWLFILIRSLPHADWTNILGTLFATIFTEYELFSGQSLFYDFLKCIIEHNDSDS